MEKLSDTNPITEAKPDRRILKTKRAIYEALVELMQKKKLNSISTEKHSTLIIQQLMMFLMKSLMSLYLLLKTLCILCLRITTCCLHRHYSHFLILLCLM